MPYGTDVSAKCTPMDPKRPKPVHLHLHAATVERLAQSLLCRLVEKMGSVMKEQLCFVICVKGRM